MKKFLSTLAVLSALTGVTQAFQLPRHGTVSTRIGSTESSSSTSLGMAPRYEKATERWFVTDEETEGPSAGYDKIGSLYRAGPVPFIQRIVNADSYEQAVLKYMAQEGCDRVEAQGNMDAYLENPQDWAYQKMCEKNKGAPKKDYANANMKPKQIILSTMWACLVVVFAYDVVTGVADGRYARPGDGSNTDLFHGNLWNLPF